MLRIGRTPFGALIHYITDSDSTLCGAGEWGACRLAPQGVVNCPRCIARLPKVGEPVAIPEPTYNEARRPWQPQRVEVVINGKLHRRPDPGSERCTCLWAPPMPHVSTDGVALTWAEHIYHIISKLEYP